jgi:hypothetical protein
LSQINPLAGAILQSIQTQRQMGVEKERQVRQEQTLEKDVAAADDRFEHQVESSEIVTDPNDGGQSGDQRNPKKRRPKENEEEEEPHIDLTA